MKYTTNSGYGAVLAHLFRSLPFIPDVFVIGISSGELKPSSQLSYPLKKLIYHLQELYDIIKPRTEKNFEFSYKNVSKTCGYFSDVIQRDMRIYIHVRTKRTCSLLRRTKLSFEEDIMLWNGKICIPLDSQTEILAIHDDGHPGITIMQSLTNLHVYWPECTIDFVRKTEKCSFYRYRS